jgi:hypothetical protein
MLVILNVDFTEIGISKCCSLDYVAINIMFINTISINGNTIKRASVMQNGETPCLKSVLAALYNCAWVNI